MSKLGRRSLSACSLFRVSTKEILDELNLRCTYKVASNLKEFSSKELLEFVLSERMDSFSN